MTRSIEDLSKTLGKYFPSLIRHAKDKHELQIALSQGLDALEQGSLSWARLNQILHLCSQAGMSEGFYQYYFLCNPGSHPYPCDKVFPDESYEPPKDAVEIQFFLQLKWGIQRFFYDAMLFWGNFRQAYRDLRTKDFTEISEFFSAKRTNENRLITRGKVEIPIPIPRDERYLISETACKTYYGMQKIEDGDHVRAALEAFDELCSEGAAVTPEKLKDRARLKAEGDLPPFIGPLSMRVVHG